MYKVVVYAPAERADTLPPFLLYPICTLWFESVKCVRVWFQRMPEQPGRNSVMYLQIRSYSVLSDFMAHNKNMWGGGETIYDQHILRIEEGSRRIFALCVTRKKSYLHLCSNTVYYH